MQYHIDTQCNIKKWFPPYNSWKKILEARRKAHTQEIKEKALALMLIDQQEFTRAEVTVMKLSVSHACVTGCY